MTPADIAAIRKLVERARQDIYAHRREQMLREATDALLAEREAREAELAEARESLAEVAKRDPAWDRLDEIARRAVAVNDKIDGTVSSLRADLARVTAERDQARENLESLEHAASFVLDYAADLGQCAICDGGIGKSDEPEESECAADCPGRLLRSALGKGGAR